MSFSIFRSPSDEPVKVKVRLLRAKGQPKTVTLTCTALPQAITWDGRVFICEHHQRESDAIFQLGQLDLIPEYTEATVVVIS